VKRLILTTVLSLSLASALNATDFTSMTTEELLNLKGTVTTEEREAFRDELRSRISTMSTEEKESLGITPNGYGDMTGSAPQDGTGLGNTGETRGGFGGGSSSGGGFGGMGGGHGHGHGERR